MYHLRQERWGMKIACRRRYGGRQSDCQLAVGAAQRLVFPYLHKLAAHKTLVGKSRMPVGGGKITVGSVTMTESAG